MDVDLNKLVSSVEQEVRGTGTSELRVTQFNTRIGFMTAAATETGLCLLQYSDSERLGSQFLHIAKALDAVPSVSTNEHLSLIESQLTDWLCAARDTITVPYECYGTEFQKRVWQKISEVPYGSTVTFGEIAFSVNRPGAIRAVAAAIGANTMAVVLPCHRVVSAGGGIKGYSGGIDRKKWLIEFEKNTVKSKNS